MTSDTEPLTWMRIATGYYRAGIKYTIRQDHRAGVTFWSLRYCGKLVSDLLNQTLPEAVRKHMRVMEIELPAGRPVRIEAARVDDHGERWVSFQDQPRLGPEMITYLIEHKATKVALHFPGEHSAEFDIEEMVW